MIVCPDYVIISMTVHANHSLSTVIPDRGYDGIFVRLSWSGQTTITIVLHADYCRGAIFTNNRTAFQLIPAQSMLVV